VQIEWLNPAMALTGVTLTVASFVSAIAGIIVFRRGPRRLAVTGVDRFAALRTADHVLGNHAVHSLEHQSRPPLPHDHSQCVPANRSRDKIDRMSEVTRILPAVEQGDPHAAEQLLPLVYDELRKLAARKLGQERPGQTLQATALVHEAYIRLVDGEKAQSWMSRGHFFAAAAEAMRRIFG
jgi:hypothetical protein